eukprot:CAMPEP_0202900098 /NCGR_PEP_ID=MMETSP1392-20130828/9822_1 /ASSEMBLY_ACC=CAM_ASM_000868 /TAXON_ID=225041 /ORGANISM="Chlamydomonas chlamydogama, Strain SAG 11-48b" /LENGTH=89 /DNA_ID=CAMNT_0049586415 /DNA_START=107 /DNA_END=373 /DNA_ORIENTATION=-
MHTPHHGQAHTAAKLPHHPHGITPMQKIRKQHEALEMPQVTTQSDQTCNTQGPTPNQLHDIDHHAPTFTAAPITQVTMAYIGNKGSDPS